MNNDEDDFLEDIKKHGYFSNTSKVLKWYDGIDLTINQSFKEQKEIIGKNNYFVFVNKENSTYNKEDIYNSRFFYQDKIEKEIKWMKEIGCECCGRKLIMPIENQFNLCEDCDRKIFSNTKSSKYFKELSEDHTCCPKEFHIFINKIKVNTTIFNFFKINKIRKLFKEKWNPFLKFN